MKKTPKYIPKTQKVYSWELSRRNFIKGGTALIILSQLQLLTNCTNSVVENSVLNEEQLDIVLFVQNFLFPKDNLGPSAKEINADLYLIWVLSDGRFLKEDKQYLLDGIKWVQETAEENFKLNYSKLTTIQKNELLVQVSQKSWGENWLSYMLTFIIEAMVSDPVYGFNKNGVGVKWLSHEYGVPRPDKTTKYPEIFNTVLKNG